MSLRDTLRSALGAPLQSVVSQFASTAALYRRVTFSGGATSWSLLGTGLPVLLSDVTRVVAEKQFGVDTKVTVKGVVSERDTVVIGIEPEFWDGLMITDGFHAGESYVVREVRALDAAQLINLWLEKLPPGARFDGAQF